MEKLPEDRWEIKEGTSDQDKRRGNYYDPAGDYILIRGEEHLAIERKTMVDLYNSILDGRVYGQLAELCALHPGRAVLLLEHGYIPKKLNYKRGQIEKAVFTFFNERSLLMPCMYSPTPKYSYHLLRKLGQNLGDMGIHGRGVKVEIEEGYEDRYPLQDHKQSILLDVD